jgi:NIPSNAP
VILEIRTYRLHAGTGPEFVRLMCEEGIPLLRAAGIRVVGAGSTLVAEDGHEEAYLIRAFESLTQHEQQENDFYGGDAWRKGPREAIMALIDQYHSIVLEVPESVVVEFERANQT